MKSYLLIALALLAGVSGGLLSRYIAPPAAYAQNKQPPTAEIRALRFVLVDFADRPIGTFTTEANSRIVLRDNSGRVIWRAGGSGLLPATER
jgi:hypothetical protein